MNDTLDRIPSNPTADKIDEAFSVGQPYTGPTNPVKSDEKSEEMIGPFRARMNLSRREVATLAGVTQSQVWRIEKLSAAGELPMSDVPLWTTIWDALVGFEGENPAGKPKATPKTKSPKTDNTAHKNDLEALAANVSLAIAIMKEKKQSSASMQALLTQIDEMLANLK